MARYWIKIEDAVEGPYEGLALKFVPGFSEDAHVSSDDSLEEVWLPAREIAELQALLHPLPREARPAVPPPPPPPVPLPSEPLEFQTPLEPVPPEFDPLPAPPPSPPAEAQAPKPPPPLPPEPLAPMPQPETEEYPPYQAPAVEPWQAAPEAPESPQTFPEPPAPEPLYEPKPPAPPAPEPVIDRLNRDVQIDFSEPPPPAPGSSPDSDILDVMAKLSRDVREEASRQPSLPVANFKSVPAVPAPAVRWDAPPRTFRLRTSTVLILLGALAGIVGLAVLAPDRAAFVDYWRYVRDKIKNRAKPAVTAPLEAPKDKEPSAKKKPAAKPRATPPAEKKAAVQAEPKPELPKPSATPKEPPAVPLKYQKFLLPGVPAPNVGRKGAAKPVEKKKVASEPPPASEAPAPPKQEPVEEAPASMGKKRPPARFEPEPLPSEPEPEAPKGEPKTKKKEPASNSGEENPEAQKYHDFFSQPWGGKDEEN